jgi:DNA-binding FadR family transcriptional regulator
MLDHFIDELHPLNLSEEIVKSIRTLIVSGKIKPGEKLPTEKELAKLFGVGISTIREAIFQLKGAGYVEVRRPKGMFALPVSDSLIKAQPLIDLLEYELKNVCDFYRVRKNLEADCAYHAALNADSETLEKMRKVLDQMEQAKILNNPELWISTDADLHLLIANASENLVSSYVINVFSTLLNSTKSQRIIMDADEKSEEIWQEHLGIYEAIKNHDGDGARRQMMEHMDKSIIRVTEKWNSEKKGGKELI